MTTYHRILYHIECTSHCYNGIPGIQYNFPFHHFYHCEKRSNRYSILVLRKIHTHFLPHLQSAFPSHRKLRGMHCLECLHWNLSAGHETAAQRSGDSSLPSLHWLTPSHKICLRMHRFWSHKKPVSPLIVQFVALALHGPSLAYDSSSAIPSRFRGQSMSPSHTSVGFKKNNWVTAEDTMWRQATNFTNLPRIDIHSPLLGHINWSNASKQNKCCTMKWNWLVFLFSLTGFAIFGWFRCLT